jgi:hypothetical protein
MVRNPAWPILATSLRRISNHSVQWIDRLGADMLQLGDARGRLDGERRLPLDSSESR